MYRTTSQRFCVVVCRSAPSHLSDGHPRFVQYILNRYRRLTHLNRVLLSGIREIGCDRVGQMTRTRHVYPPPPWTRAIRHLRTIVAESRRSNRSGRRYERSRRHDTVESSHGHHGGEHRYIVWLRVTSAHYFGGVLPLLSLSEATARARSTHTSCAAPVIGEEAL